jgi:Zn-dependent protease
VANLLGDPTAKLLGRISLNPIVHIDTFGTVIIPAFLILWNLLSPGTALPIFGWAKPTPINPFNFRHPLRDSALSAFAGPASNFVLAIAGAILFRIFPNDILFFFVTINLILGIFNLIPFPPLDGYKVLLGVLPKGLAIQLSAIERMGPILFFVLIFVFFQFLSPLISTVLGYLQFLLLGQVI